MQGRRRYARSRFDERLQLQPDRHRGPALRRAPARLTRHAPRDRSLERWTESEALTWYADEILICEGDLIGKTQEQLRSVHFRRDRDWLQS